MKNKLTTAIFFNHCFDKRRFQNFIYWFFKKSHSGQSRLLKFLEKLKFLGFHSATQAGFSISIDDLKIPSSKSEILLTAENIVFNADIQLISGNLTIIERYQRIIEIWNRTSEELKYQVLQSFKISDFVNPVYLMAFSGARGNISQIRQLVGMRGLMADPQGQIIDFPIRSNFREGLTLTEYLISCSGARKGIVDTALRTAASGYLTRRLVDVAHHVIVNQIDCQMEKNLKKKRRIKNSGIFIEDLYDQQKKILSLQQRLVGRVLAETISGDKHPFLIIGQKDHEISKITSQKICKYRKKVFIRSPLTCQSSKFICQLCYGWNLAEGQLVSVGEAVGVLAAQSIGEPGTQMTMRTFHTGGVFTGILMDQTYAPFSGIVHYNFPCNGLLIRTLQGKIAYLSKNNGILSIFQDKKINGQSEVPGQPARALAPLAFAPRTPEGAMPPRCPPWGPMAQGACAAARPAPLGAEGLAMLSNYKTLLHQLRKFNCQLKGIIFFNQIGFKDNLTFLRKNIKKKNKLRNIHRSNFFKKVYKAGKASDARSATDLRAAQAPGKNLVWKIDHLKNKYSCGQVRISNTQSKLQKQIQFIFQNFTILYVRQNENVRKKQLIAELPFFENEKSLENEQEILSNESGEIYFRDFVLLEKTISDFQIVHPKNFVQNLGEFWILFGRSWLKPSLMTSASVFLKKLDLVDQNVPFSQIQIESYNFLNNKIDDLFYKNNFLQFEQIFLSSFLRKINTNHKKQTQEGSEYSSTNLGPSGYTSTFDFNLDLKRYSQTFQMNLIFFKKLGYLQIPNMSLDSGSSGPESNLQVMTEKDNRKIDHPGAPWGTHKAPSFQNINLNFIKKIQVFNGIEPISTKFWNKNKVFWNYRKISQRGANFETWMIGLQGQSKYINEYSDFRNQFLKISIKHFQINYLKQNSFKFKDSIHSSQNRYFSLNFGLIFNNIFSSLSFQKQKINFLLSDTGLILKKNLGTKFFCEFQNPNFLKKYFVKRADRVFNYDQVILKNQNRFDLTFLAQSKNFFFNVNQASGILFVNRQGIFQSFGRKVLRGCPPSWHFRPKNQIQKINKFSRPSEKRIFRKKINAAKSTVDYTSFRIGTQKSWYTNTTKQICKIQRFARPKGPFGAFGETAAQAPSAQMQVPGDTPTYGGLSFRKPMFALRSKHGYLNMSSFFSESKIYIFGYGKFSFGYFYKKLNLDIIKIQSIFCNLFLKQSRLFQNLPKNWARQITIIQPKVIHWKNLPNSKYIFLLNFITNLDSAKYIEQKNLKTINDYGQTQKRSPANSKAAALGGESSRPKFINEYYKSRFKNQKTQLALSFLEKSQHPKKLGYQGSLCSAGAWRLRRWHLALAPLAEEPKQNTDKLKLQLEQIYPVCKNLRIGSKNQTKNLLKNPVDATQIVIDNRIMIRANNQRFFQIKQYNFWKIQQRQEIIGYQKLKIGFYSFIRIFFSIETSSFEDLKWMQDVSNVFYHHSGNIFETLKQSTLGGDTLVSSIFSTLTIFTKLLTNIMNFNRFFYNDVFLKINKHVLTLLPFNGTKHFFKTLKVQRASQKYDCSRFRQKIPQIFSIDEKIFVHKKSAAGLSSFSYFFCQGTYEIHLFLVRKHINKKILSRIPYKTVLNIQKNGIKHSGPLPRPFVLSSENNKIEENILTGKVNRHIKKRQILTQCHQLWTSKFTDFFQYHQQIFYEKFKKNFQNIHLNSSDGTLLTNLLDHTGSEDQCIKWKFFGDWAIILETNIYSTYFKHFSLIENKLGPLADNKRFAGAGNKASRIIQNKEASVPSFREKRADLKNQFCTMYPSINKVLTSDSTTNAASSYKQFEIRSGLQHPSEFHASGERRPIGGRVHIEVSTENRAVNVPAISLNEKTFLFFDKILPRSLIRSEFGILKNTNKIDSSKLQKWILDHYFDSYLLIVHDFSLLKNFENRFFQSLPKKPIYNKFYYHDNKIETGSGQAAKYTKQIIVKKNKLQENIIRKYSIPNIRIRQKLMPVEQRTLSLNSHSATEFNNNNEFNTIVNFWQKPSNNRLQRFNLQDFFEFPNNLYNFYIEFISKKSSRLKSDFHPIKNLHKINMKTWLNSLKNIQKYSSRYLKSRIISRKFPLFVKNQDNLLQKDITKIPGLRYKKYLSQTIFCLQKLDNDMNKKKQYYFVLKFYRKNLDNFYSIRAKASAPKGAESFFSQHNRKSFRIPFLWEDWEKVNNLFLNSFILKPNIDIFRKILHFKTYKIFKILLLIYLNYPKSVSIQENIHEFKLYPKQKAQGRKPCSLNNLMSLTQTEYLNNFLLQNCLKYQIPLFDKNFKILLVSIVPIIFKSSSVLNPNDSSYQKKDRCLANNNLLQSRRLRPGRPVHQAPFVHNLKIIDNQTHSLKIHITKTKRLNFLTQKYLTNYSEYLCQNRNLNFTHTNLLSLSKVISQQFSNLQGKLLFGNSMNFQIIKVPLGWHSSEIQIFIRFFLPFHSGEIIDPLFYKQENPLLFANISDFFSFRDIARDNAARPAAPLGARCPPWGPMAHAPRGGACAEVRSDVLNYNNQVILEQKFQYFLEKGQTQKTNVHTFFLKNKSTIFYRLQLQNKNKYISPAWAPSSSRRGPGLGMSLPIKSAGQLDFVSNFKCIKFSRKSKIYKYEFDLNFNKFNFQLQRQQKIKIENFKTQQLCMTHKIFYSYKLSQNYNTSSTTILTQNGSAGLRRRPAEGSGFASPLARLSAPLPGGPRVHPACRLPRASAFSTAFQYLTHFNKKPENIVNQSREQPIILGSFFAKAPPVGALLSAPKGGTSAPKRATSVISDGTPQFHFQGGQFIAKTQHILLFRKATTHLLNDQSVLHIQHGDIIFKNQPLFSVFYNQSKTGDIVQGIPKIEEIFEARKKSKYKFPILSKDFLFFEKIIIKYLRSLQKSVVNNIQRIYCGQGIHISDKHIEIIVRQMTSNVLILEPGQTGLLYGEIVALQWISQINAISNQVIYEPVLIGMTKTCLETSSFLSAASFQETTRILGRAALQNQIDFIRGLKQNVILGNLIPIGTGCF